MENENFSELRFTELKKEALKKEIKNKIDSFFTTKTILDHKLLKDELDFSVRYKDYLLQRKIEYSICLIKEALHGK